jgi:hypothetical protein
LHQPPEQQLPGAQHPLASTLVGINLHDSRLQRRFDWMSLRDHCRSHELQPPLEQGRLQQGRMVTLAGSTLRDCLGSLVLLEAELVVPDQLDADLPISLRKHLEVAVMPEVGCSQFSV